MCFNDHWCIRSVPGVEDTTAMTIEFLRARLLSERSVSKSARQRADELAKRVQCLFIIFVGFVWLLSHVFDLEIYFVYYRLQNWRSS